MISNYLSLVKNSENVWYGCERGDMDTGVGGLH